MNHPAMNAAVDPALPHYEHLAHLSGQMLAHARGQDWDTVVTLCQRYQQAIEELRQVAELPAVTSGADAARVSGLGADTATDTAVAPSPAPTHINAPARQALLSKILSDDAHLRDLTTPELARLGRLLGTFKRKRTLHQAYGAS